jgi:REP element-mobilizing transposase RayT
MASSPLAYFITWSCRGTWLHGDARGSVDREHNTFGSPFIEPDVRRRAAESGLLNDPPLTLDPTRRAAVDDAIRGICRRRRWTIHALQVRSTHVHVVISAEMPPERVMQQLKAWGTRALRSSGNSGSPWTRHGSTRYLWTDEDLSNAGEYVMEEQDRRERFKPK